MKTLPESGYGSPTAVARIAGTLWLMSIVTGIFAEVFVRGSLIVHGDAQATSARIIAAEPLFRLGFAADLVGDMAYTGVTILLYELLRPVSRGVSLTALAFGLTGCAVMAANLVNLFVPLVLFAGASALNSLPPERAALALAFLRLHGQGYSLSIAFFAIQVGALGYMILRSEFLPRILGVLLVIEAVCNLVSSFGGFLAIAWVGRLDSYILLPGLPAEGGMTLWLLVMGVNAQKWAASYSLHERYGPGSSDRSFLSQRL